MRLRTPGIVSSDAVLCKPYPYMREMDRRKLHIVLRIVDLVRCPGKDRDGEILSLKAHSSSPRVKDLHEPHACLIPALLRNKVIREVSLRRSLIDAELRMIFVRIGLLRTKTVPPDPAMIRIQ